MRLINWFKQNKIIVLLLIIVIYLLINRSSSFSQPEPASFKLGDTSIGSANISSPGIMLGAIGGSAPSPETIERKVLRETFLSLQVKDVSQSLSEIKDFAQKSGGYMVNSNLTRPQEAAYGEIIIRVPQTKLDESLVYLRNLSVKVVSENLSGTDVTDQYVDNDARLAILTKNKAKFEEIMAKAVSVEEILKVQTEIFNIQKQTDDIKGQQQYLLKSAETVKITISLSTDEFALPYAPERSFRPEVIFKQAVRSLIITMQGLGSAVIWLGVYAVIWIPALIIFLFFKRINNKQQTTGNK